MTEKIMKRFIAGAVCPKCSEMDKLVMYRNEQDEQVRECVSCGYSDKMNEHGHTEELATRVNQVKAGEKPLAHEDEVSIVSILDPKKNN